MTAPRPAGSPPQALSAAEERFDRRRRTLGLFLGPLAAAAVLLSDTPSLSPEAHRLAAIVSLVVVWWVTEAIPIPVTALVGAALAAVAGVAPASQVFAPFASPTVFLFLGSFVLGQAVSEHGLDRRLAVGILSLGAVGKSPTRVRTAAGLLTLVVSAWMSNTATTAMMLPVALGLIRSRAQGPGERAAGREFQIGLLLVIAYSASLGGMMTPVGSPPNLITIGLLEQTTGERIDFVRWMLVASPITLMMALALWALAAWRFPAPPGVEAAAAAAHDEATGPWTRGQRNCAFAFGTAVVLWVTPGILALVAPDSALRKLVSARLDEAVVAVLAAALLFLLPVDWKQRRFTLGWEHASRIDWGTLLLFGGGLSLGHLMFETGLAKVIGNGVADLAGAESPLAITAIAAALGIYLTEITSNTAATNMLVPVVISLAQARGVDPVMPSLATGLGASLAFMLPISTPPNAIVYGTGMVPIGRMVSAGFLLDIAALVIVVGGLTVLAPLVL